MRLVLVRPAVLGMDVTDLLPLAVLQSLWPHGDQHIPGLVEGIANAAPDVFDKYGIATPLVVAMMFGQFSEECGAGLSMIENMNYSAAGLVRTFPTHFTATLAAQAAHNPVMIAEIAYGGRMGNAPPPSTDGYVYRGHGIPQCTGKEAYAALGKTLGVDLVANPDWLIDPDNALEGGVADFIQCGCMPFALQGNVLGVTRKLNGGTNGLAARQSWTARWKQALGVSA